MEELTGRQAAALGLPGREPLYPFSELTWYEREGDDEKSAPGEVDRLGEVSGVEISGARKTTLGKLS